MTILSSALALRTAVHQRLTGDAALGVLLGGPRVYDEPPRGTLPPYVVFSTCETTDFSGDDAPAAEHALGLEVWSREGGLSEALKVSDRLVRLLDGAALTLDGFRLVSLAWGFTDAGRAADAGFRRAALKFRAVTEPD